MNVLANKQQEIFATELSDDERERQKEEFFKYYYDLRHSEDPRMDWLEIRKLVYECQKWYRDVWDEEVTYYSGHNVITPKQAYEFVDKVDINKGNGHIFADILVRREEDKKYDLIKYLRENIKI